MLKFERKFIKPEEIMEGTLPPRFFTPLFGLLSIILVIPTTIFYHSVNHIVLVDILSIILARLIVIDLRHYVLPDVYTIPLFILGASIAPLVGLIGTTQALLGAGVGLIMSLSFSLGYEFIRKQQGLGMGAVKLITAAGAWVGLTQLPFFLCTACMISLVLSFTPAHKNNHIPFGPGLCLALWIHVLFGQQILSIILQ